MPRRKPRGVAADIPAEDYAAIRDAARAWKMPMSQVIAKALSAAAESIRRGGEIAIDYRPAPPMLDVPGQIGLDGEPVEPRPFQAAGVGE